MKQNFPISLDFVLKHEGGWSEHPADPGGATMKGVTLATFSKFLGRPASKEELKAITDAQLKAIYGNLYWNRIIGDGLPAGVDMAVFDMAVNAGPGRSAKILQEVVGAVADGVIGAKTIAAINTKTASELIQGFSNARRAFYESLPTFGTFGKGWLRRVDDCEKEAQHLAEILR